MQSSDLMAKLLAQENITITRSNVKTASFDIKNRVLMLPVWKDMTEQIEELMLCHEVGHALFTDADAWALAINSFHGVEQRVIHGYMNVVEDARIEKLMKRRFPGARKVFYSAYKQLVERDFFKLKGRNINNMSLIDRINLYFKCGYSIGAKFSDDEKIFVDKVEKVESITEAIELAKEIYEFCKEDANNRKLENNEDLAEDDFNLIEDEFDNDEDADYEEDFAFNAKHQKDYESDKNASGKGNFNPEEIESQTDKELNASLEELADDTIKYNYYELFTGLCHDPIVNYKTILSETYEIDEIISQDRYCDHKKDFDKFILESERIVNYLVKEFEMHKSAQAYSRTKISKSGALNMNKIHAYKTTDDIFRRITTIPNGKNHGMIFLLDWSGSMQNVILPTIQQVINLVMFCRRTNIPFEVYAFSNRYVERMSINELNKKRDYIREILNTGKQQLFSNGYYSLLNLFSSKMTNNEFLTLAKRFSSHHIESVEGYNLGETPLNDALLHMVDLIPDFIRNNGIEKMSFVTLTDGQGSCLAEGLVRVKKAGYNDEKTKYVKYRNFIRDFKTQKTYEIGITAQSQTETLFKLIKDRYNTASLGFYICQNKNRTLKYAVYDNTGKEATEKEIEHIRNEFKKNGFYSMMGTGRDELFIVPDSSTKIVDEELQVDSQQSASTIAKRFTKQFNSKKHSRILLDRFIEHIA